MSEDRMRFSWSESGIFFHSLGAASPHHTRTQTHTHMASQQRNPMFWASQPGVGCIRRQSTKGGWGTGNSGRTLQGGPCLRSDQGFPKPTRPKTCGIQAWKKSCLGFHPCLYVRFPFTIVQLWKLAINTKQNGCCSREGGQPAVYLGPCQCRSC